MNQDPSSKNLVVVVKGQISEEHLRDYLEVASQTMQALKAHNKDIILSKFSTNLQDKTNFRWVLLLQSYSSLLKYFSSPIIALYMANHNQLGRSYEIEIYGSLAEDEIDELNEMGLTFELFSCQAGYDNLEVLH